MKDKLKQISYKIDKVLIDESHTVEKDSLYRYNLIDFESKVKSICNDSLTSIVTVTASPNLYSKVDIVIDNEGIKESTINVSKDREKALKRIKNDIKNNENIVVFTNSTTVIYHLRNYKNELEANFVIGESLTRNLTELFTIIPNKQSNLTIVSSRGFEGFDIYKKDAKIYFFEDRANEFETFFLSNLYQAINRVRNGAKYIEYNRLELSDSRKQDFKNIDIEVENFINDSSISASEKQRTEYKKYKKFVIFQQDDAGAFTVKKNEVAIQLYKETLLYDKSFPAPEFEPFLNARKIKINLISDVNNRINKKVKASVKEKNLLNNSKLIDELNLFGENYILEVKDLHSIMFGKPTHENRELYLKHFKTYLRRKNYKGDRTLTEREKIALNLLKDVKKYNNLVSKVTRAYDNRSIDKYGLKASAPYRETFKNKSYNVVCKLILMFVNNRIGLPSKWIANRNYNLLTEIGVNELKIVGDIFNVKVSEIDIQKCFSRVLYGINGIALPSDFYGINKENKLTINVFLNDFFYKSELTSEKKLQKNNAIIKFRKLGFNEVVIKYLIDNFFECAFRGDLFNKLSFYEKKIISEVKELCKDKNNSGVIRRHDSIIVFDNKEDLTFLNDCEFLNVKGWFNVKEVPVIQLEPETSFESFIQELELNKKIASFNGYQYQKYLAENFHLMAL